MMRIASACARAAGMASSDKAAKQRRRLHEAPSINLVMASNLLIAQQAQRHPEGLEQVRSRRGLGPGSGAVNLHALAELRFQEGIVMIDPALGDPAVLIQAEYRLLAQHQFFAACSTTAQRSTTVVSPSESLFDGVWAANNQLIGGIGEIRHRAAQLCLPCLQCCQRLHLERLSWHQPVNPGVRAIQLPIGLGHVRL